jgi:hypothetical protein
VIRRSASADDVTYLDFLVIRLRAPHELVQFVDEFHDFGFLEGRLIVAGIIVRLRSLLNRSLSGN